MVDRADINNGRRRGRRLAAELGCGREPETVPADLILQPGEECYGVTPARIHQWLPGDGIYVHKSGGYFGFPSAVAVGTVNMIGNALRRAAAGRDLARQWRPHDQGNLYVTNRRIAIQGEVRWTDLWFGQIRMLESDDGVLIVEIAEKPRLMIEIAAADYWFVLIHKLGWGVVKTPPRPDDETGLEDWPPGDSAPVDIGPAAEVPSELVGTWVSVMHSQRFLEIGAGGDFTIRQPDLGVRTDRLVVSGNRLMMDENGRGALDYDWLLTGDRLSLVRNGLRTSYDRAR